MRRGDISKEWNQMYDAEQGSAVGGHVQAGEGRLHLGLTLSSLRRGRPGLVPAWLSNDIKAFFPTAR